MTVPEPLFHNNAPIAPGNQIYLERPQIYSLLNEAVQGPVVTVVAGAGYGKTYSVSSFLRTYHGVTTWMQMSERDNMGWHSWENFTQAVSSRNNEFAVKLTAIGFPETERQFNRYLTVLDRVLRPGIKYVMVYDDFHLIHSAPVKRFVERSINTPHPSITFIIISRSEPAINTIGLLSRGLLFKITEDDLRFSQDEMGRYFQIQKVRLSQSVISDIYHDTEGWAFAIHLIGLALKNNPAGTGYARSSMKHNIFKLIEGEIFSPLSKNLQKYLIKLSFITERLSLELATELASAEGPPSGREPGSPRSGGVCGKKLIEEMRKVESFIHFDAYLNFYRIHPLFLEYLIGKQGCLSGEEKQDVYIRAARWCAENNRKLDAISYYEKAGAYDRLIEVVYTFSLAIPDHIARFLVDILNRAPREIYDNNDSAWVLYGGLLFISGKFEEAAAKTWEIIKKFEALPPSAFNSRVLYGCYNNLGFIAMITSLYTHDYGFPAYFEKAHHYYPLSAHETCGPMTSITLGSYANLVGIPQKGEMEKFIEALTMSVPHIVVTINGCSYGMDDLARCELAYFRGDMITTKKFALIALRKAQERNQYQLENRALFYLLRLNIALGNYDALQDVFRILKCQLEKTEYINRYIFYDIVLGWFYAHIGAGEKIASWLKDDFEESELNSLIHGLETLVRIKCYIAEKRYPAALAAMESHENRYDLGAYLFGKIGLKVLEAVCRYHMGEKKPALRAMEAAYNLAESNALDMIFIEQGKEIRALVDTALKDETCFIPRPWLEQIRRKASAYGKKLFAVAEQYREQNMERRGLSRREIKVLVGLSQGLTREELAEDGGISINTVKSVIKSVYNKLGAINRADAVRIATAMGILKSYDT
jgi:LuxR family maltose regulon positive regulatory protein